MPDGTSLVIDLLLKLDTIDLFYEICKPLDYFESHSWRWSQGNHHRNNSCRHQEIQAMIKQLWTYFSEMHLLLIEYGQNLKKYFNIHWYEPPLMKDCVPENERWKVI